MKRRRRRNLSRNQKLGIILLAVASVGGATAVTIGLRRRKKGELPQGGDTQGVPGLPNPLNRAKRRLCINPNALTAEQRNLLQQQVFFPLIAAQANPEAVGTAEVVAAQVLAQLCPAPRRPGVVDVVNQLAQQSWQTFVGFAG